jgi:hypothetical protein
LRRREMARCANKRNKQCSKTTRYSITSSASSKRSRRDAERPGKSSD